MREMQGRMRHLQQTIGPPIGPDGRPLMMGPGGPMGPRPPGPPPNHPVMMEMAALDKHLRGLYQQPQTPELHAQVKVYLKVFIIYLTYFVYRRFKNCKAE